MVDKIEQPHGGALTPFKPGQSGNPSGKKKGTKNMSTIFRELLEQEHQKKNPITGEQIEASMGTHIGLAHIKKATEGDVASASFIVDRVEGKPTQKTETTEVPWHEAVEEIESE